MRWVGREGWVAEKEEVDLPKNCPAPRDYFIMIDTLFYFYSIV